MMTIYNIVEKDKRFLVAPPKALHRVNTRLCDSLNILQTRALHLVRKQESDKIKDLEDEKQGYIWATCSITDFSMKICR